MKLPEDNKKSIIEDLNWVKEIADCYIKNIQNDEYENLYALRSFRERTEKLDLLKETLFYLRNEDQS